MYVPNAPDFPLDWEILNKIVFPFWVIWTIKQVYQLFIVVIKVPDKNDIEEEKFILAHLFSGPSLQPTDSIALELG